MDWIDLTQDRDSLQVHVAALMNLWVLYNAGDLLASQEGLCSMHGLLFFMVFLSILHGQPTVVI